MWFESLLCHFLALISSVHGGDTGPDGSQGLSEGTGHPWRGDLVWASEAKEVRSVSTWGGGLQWVSGPQEVGGWPGGGGSEPERGGEVIPVCGGGEWQWWEIGYIKGGDLIDKCAEDKAQIFTSERGLQVGEGRARESVLRCWVEIGGISVDL